MIRIFGADLKWLLDDDRFLRIHNFGRKGLNNSQIIGIYKGEEVFLCPFPLIERKRGICDRCLHRFRCFTEKWGV